jgi:hypothetical protein
MPLDPNIPLQAGPAPQQYDPLAQAAKLYTLKSAMQQSQMGDYELQDQMTLRNAAGLPNVKNQDGSMNISALLGEVSGKVSPKTMMILSDASQKQQTYKQQQEDRQRKITEEFFTKGGDLAASIVSEFDKNAATVGPEKAWEIVQPKAEAMRQQLSQLTGKELPPSSGIDAVRQLASHSKEYRAQQLKSTQPMTPAEQSTRALKEREVAARERAVGIQERKADYGMTGAGALSPDAVKVAVEQYRSGDSTAAQGYARNANMKAAFQNELAKQLKEEGKSGKDQAAAIAEFQGIKAGQRSLGTRTAQAGMAVAEARRMIPLALDASEKATRTGMKSLNEVEQAVQRGTASPELRRFVAANNSLINVYARAINPTGVPTVSDKEHARDVLSVAFSKGDYKAAVEQLQKEMEAAMASPGDIREEFRQTVTGTKGAVDSGTAPPAKRKPLSEFSGARG